jgi:hypothetical protein
MTIDEAIRVNTVLKETQKDDQNIVQALSLGIEALKWRQRFVAALPSAGHRPLPGETKD